jgi:hypothetical protein
MKQLLPEVKRCPQESLGEGRRRKEGRKCDTWQPFLVCLNTFFVVVSFLPTTEGWHTHLKPCLPSSTPAEHVVERPGREGIGTREREAISAADGRQFFHPPLFCVEKRELYVVVW